MNDFLARLAIAILDYLRRNGVSYGVDADRDPASLSRAGRRISEWMRKQDGMGS